LGLGFGVEGGGFGVWVYSSGFGGLEFSVFEFGCLLGSGFRVLGSVFRVEGMGVGVQFFCLDLRVQGFLIRVQGLGDWV